MLAVLLWPYLPASTERLLAALGAEDTSLAGAELGRGAISSRRAGRGAVPEGAARGGRGLIDSHTHLDLCEPPDAELVAAAEAVGVSRILTVGIDGASCARRARRGRGLPSGLRGDRPPPQLGARVR